MDQQQRGTLQRRRPLAGPLQRLGAQPDLPGARWPGRRPTAGDQRPPRADQRPDHGHAAVRQPVRDDGRTRAGAGRAAVRGLRAKVGRLPGLRPGAGLALDLTNAVPARTDHVSLALGPRLRRRGRHPRHGTAAAEGGVTAEPMG